jgi:hypothetical protein
VTRAVPVLLAALAVGSCPLSSSRIDRHALVSRHNPTLRSADPLSPLSLGNGAFAFTADVTGLQTFPGFYDPDTSRSVRGSTPLVTEAEWAWHSFPNPSGYTLADTFETYDTYGRPVEHASRQDTPAAAWLRENPHRLPLPRVGFVLRRADGAEATLDDLTQTEQTLDLWSGTLSSRFAVEGSPVRVESWVHPDRDLLAVRVSPGAVPLDRLAVRLVFPAARAIHSGDPSDWTEPNRGTTAVVRWTPHEIEWRRTLDATTYSATMAWGGPGRVESHGRDWVLSFDGAGAPSRARSRGRGRTTTGSVPAARRDSTGRSARHATSASRGETCRTSWCR